MSFWGSYSRKMLGVLVLAVVGLFAGAWLLTAAERRAWVCGDSFFLYRIYALDGMPAWFVALMTLLALNGFLVYRWATVEATLATPGWGPFRPGYALSVPVAQLKVLAANLVAIPCILMAFVIVRWIECHW